MWHARRTKAGLVVIALLMGAAISKAQQVQVSAANRTISVTATEIAERQANRAVLHVGFQIYGGDSGAVYTEAAAISQAVAAALEQAGVVKDAVASEGQSTGPVQEYQVQALTPAERAQRRYEAQQSWTVKSGPDAVAKLLAAAVAAGANASGQIDWSLDDESSLTAEASTKALAHARKIAADMAKGLGAKVGGLLYASNQLEPGRPLNGQAMAAMAGAAPVVKAAPPKLSLNAPMITRSASVAAIFAIE